MYKLVNKYGNAVVETESAVKRDRLIGQGYRLAEEDAVDDVAPTKEDEIILIAGVNLQTDGKGAEAETHSATDDTVAPAAVTEEPAKGKGKSKNGKNAAEDDKKE